MKLNTIFISASGQTEAGILHQFAMGSRVTSHTHSDSDFNYILLSLDALVWTHNDGTWLRTLSFHHALNFRLVVIMQRLKYSKTSCKNWILSAFECGSYISLKLSVIEWSWPLSDLSWTFSSLSILLEYSQTEVNFILLHSI